MHNIPDPADAIDRNKVSCAPKAPPSRVQTDATRSRIMASVKRRDTKPEILVRKAAHRLGLRFRLQVAALPGKPDLVFPKRRTAVFVHGCFWHRHPGCRMASTPKTRVEFWTEKFDRNVQRDASAINALEADGWRVLVIWECETRDTDSLRSRLAMFFCGLEPASSL